ncbi:MFS transporter [Pullulanibacillus sp. KACC 23026]|uniref:MFS transporter n=1 Tax=Pullulanibacillus sp. KACC 23026 TaxID=3028315 RepID=UPI0023AF5092|nr:MFS transporter [Pullulanibacillus sp. KACC 23026]WEG13450.1 MFS transporter [Pullulanibacillus sp. KACC 23026]
MNTLPSSGNVLDRIGIPSRIFWGYFGVMIFMMGDGLEQGWLSPYLIQHGLSVQQSATLFTAYGVTIAISSWFSGVLVDTFGTKRTMLAGLILYILGSIGFISLGIQHLHFGVMIPTYALRGFGYPLFAYSFIVWIAYRSPQNKLGAAVGWFWFVFTGGLNVLGAYYSIWAIKHLGHINTLWSALVWVIIGAIFALVINRDKLEKRTTASGKDQVKELVKGITIVKLEPKVGIAGIVRIINQAAQYAFPVFLPTYMQGFGINTNQWLGIWGTIFISNIAFNLIFGFVGDKFGWRNTVMWFGGVGCGVFTLMLYYTPQIFGGNIWLIQIVGILWGACLAGYVPLSALVPSLVKNEKGAAMSILNLGAGLCVFVGPAIVGITYASVGAQGVIWILAILYFIGSILTKFVTLPNNAKTVEISAAERLAH